MPAVSPVAIRAIGAASPVSIRAIGAAIPVSIRVIVLLHLLLRCRSYPITSHHFGSCPLAPRNNLSCCILLRTIWRPIWNPTWCPIHPN